MSLTKLALHNAPLTFIDVETTGLRPDLGHRLVEVAALRTQGLEEVERFSSLINPQREIDPGAMRVNGITPAMVADAPTFGKILPQLQQLTQGTIIVAHNAPFDMNFLQTEFHRVRQEFIVGPILDTLMLARRQYNFYSNSLGNIAATLNINTPDAHRALGDVLTTFAVFRRFSGDLTRQNRPLVSDWIRMQGGVVWRPVSLGNALPDNHPVKIGLTHEKPVKIRYRTGSGHISERVIQPLTCSGNFLVAFCHLRQEQRTFRLDRIIRAELD